MTGKVHSIQSLGTVDGPGIRCVVFMQGCPLRCAYCHNPDTWDVNGGIEFTAKELFDKVIKFKNYFKKRGGITVSGGEPLLQAEFLIEFFTLLKNEGIHTALDTSGAIYNDNVNKLLDLTDLVLLDYKMINDEDYVKYTGLKKSKVDKFLSILEFKKIPTFIRTVMVKGITLNSETANYVKSLKNKYSVIEKIEFLPFRKLCVEKYEALNIPFSLNDVPETTEEEINALLK